MCLLMVLCKCVHVHTSFGKQNRFVYVFSYIVFQIPFQISFKILLDKKNTSQCLGVRSELLLSIVYRLVFSLTDSKMGYVHVFAGSQVRRPVSYLQITNIFLFKFTSLLRIFHSYRKYSTIGKQPDTPASRTCHVPHVTSAGLESTPATTVGWSIN